MKICMTSNIPVTSSQSKPTPKSEKHAVEIHDVHNGCQVLVHVQSSSRHSWSGDLVSHTICIYIEIVQVENNVPELAKPHELQWSHYMYADNLNTVTRATTLFFARNT